MPNETALRDHAIRDHQEWLGYLQPDGLVVSAVALVDAQVILDTRGIETQQRFVPFVQMPELGDDQVSAVTDLPALCRGFLGWPADCIWGLDNEHALPDELTIALPEYGETLVPTFALRDAKPKDPAQPYLLLVKVLDLGTDMDAETTGHAAMWTASANRRFERLLRETKVPIGLLTNGTHIRLVYAPRGENTGSLTFPIYAMTEVGGRPILSAFHELLSGNRLFVAPSEYRLSSLLKRSRDYQSAVSTQLAQQVLEALYELLRGFQAADEHAHQELLRKPLAESPDEVYHGLLAVLMRLVFLLYAEDRSVMPGSSLYQQNYSVHGLFERLRVDYERYPDTMDHRYGAWAQLAALFQAVYAGCAHPHMKMPARHGYLFDPGRFPFLLGHTLEHPRLPLIADGVIHRVLEKLLILDSERLSYRTLDVEQIGSVYEAIMGFNLRTAEGASIAIKPKKSHGAPVPINLDDLLVQPGNVRAKWLRTFTDQEVSGDAVAALQSASTIDEALAALEKRIARTATPNIVPQGAMLLVPSNERRRSGSHYTPRSLTEPIVRKTLEPILQRLGDDAVPEQILDLKICDPAMGSGAFLVEVCRQLAEVLVQAWHRHKQLPTIPPDEDELLYARRLIAQRCIYGVDKNPMAVDLAKLSLWLVTLARDHPFTFVDHSMRAGDSLVGLTRKQIECFHWKGDQQELFSHVIRNRVIEALQQRRLILDAGDYLRPEQKLDKLQTADALLDDVRLTGDLVIAAFFSADNLREREAQRAAWVEPIAGYLSLRDPSLRPTASVLDLHTGPFAIRPFHWEIEFPEVFDRENPGFDAFIANPPFAGSVQLSVSAHKYYTEWLREYYPGTSGKTDLVAYFFRRCYNLIRESGTTGLIATNTIRQGDTRDSSLTYILTKQKATVYSAMSRLVWPGQASVIVSVIHIIKDTAEIACELNNRPVKRISAYLIAGTVDTSPPKLMSDKSGVLAALGNKPNGKGFIINSEEQSTCGLPLWQLLLQKNERNAEVLKPYLTGSDLNEMISVPSKRWIIEFGNRSITDAQQYSDLFSIVSDRVKGFVDRINWWQFEHKAIALQEQVALLKLQKFLAIAESSDTFAFSLVSSEWCISNAIIGFTSDSMSLFSILQSRIHELWCRTVSSSLKDDLRYVPGDCFDTFPMPVCWSQNEQLQTIGGLYLNNRARFMVVAQEGLTATYNRFHNPEETSTDILKLRELHAAMDRAVLDAYGWTDIHANCKFLLDYEDEDEDDSDTGGRKRRKPCRYRWPDEVRDEVLARLLALNHERWEEEQRSAVAEKGSKGAGVNRGKKGKVLKEERAEYRLL